MRQVLKDILGKLDEVEFRELYRALNIAKFLRKHCRDKGIAYNELIIKGVGTHEIEEMLSGSYVWDLQALAKVEAYLDEEIFLTNRKTRNAES